MLCTSSPDCTDLWDKDAQGKWQERTASARAAIASCEIEVWDKRSQRKISFEVGEAVKVADGPFRNQTGVVEEIDPERGKLRVSVTIFGRATPVELEYWQVERG